MTNRFELYGKADTPEVLDEILDALHYWIGNKNDCEVGSNMRCFIHEKFFLAREYQEICSCGAQSPMTTLNTNMFSETGFNTFELIKSLKENFADPRGDQVYTFREM
jgi:hypothetical protein